MGIESIYLSYKFLSNTFKYIPQTRKNMGLTAMVVGAGGFGKHYARILSQLNGKYENVPEIRMVVLTRTKSETAQAMAKDVQANAHPKVKVTGTRVIDEKSLASVLKMYEPAFIAITAKDKEQGDRIHVPYTIQALRCGTTLSEKPFTNASGNGDSLQYEGLNIKELLTLQWLKPFGLELPFAVVARDMMQNKQLANYLRNANNQ